jgi:hypothetical protein
MLGASIERRTLDEQEREPPIEEEELDALGKLGITARAYWLLEVSLPG